MVTRTGTPGNDNIIIDGDSFPDNFVDQLDIETGEGNDNVEFTGFFDVGPVTSDEIAASSGDTGTIRINTGEGADSVSFGDAAFFAGIVDIDTGSGDDVVTAVGTGLPEADEVDIRLGEGNDRIELNANVGDSLSIFRGTVDAGDGNDRIDVDASDTTTDIFGGEGEDVINFTAFFDRGSTIDGGSGRDIIEVVSARTRDVITVNGGEGDDSITLRDDLIVDGGTLNEELGPILANRFVANGGDGIDFITVESSGQPEFGRPPSVAEIDGGAGDDGIIGGGGDDVIDGGAGGDRLFGGDGDDDIDGGTGNDQISGDAGNDDIDGGAGNDNIVAGSGDDSIRSGTGTDVASGGGGADTFVFGRNEGTTHVTDFSTAGGDLLDVSAFGVSAAEVLASAREEDRPFFDTASRQFLGGRDATVIDLEGTEIVLRGIDLDDLSEESFLVEDDAAVA